MDTTMTTAEKRFVNLGMRKMPDTERTITMGMKWGNMATNVRGLVMYSLSPYEQKAFAGVLSKGIPNMFRRFKGQVFRVLPPFIAGYMIYSWAEKEHSMLERKDPKEFENDE